MFLFRRESREAADTRDSSQEKEPQQQKPKVEHRGTGELQFDMASPNSPATAAMNSPGSTSQAPVEKPSAPPVNILPSQLAQTYSYAHPVLLLALGASRFNALVENPVQELLKDLPWLALLQLLYVLLCLPPAGTTVSVSDGPSGNDTKSARSRKPGYRRKNSGKNDWAGIWAKLMVCIDMIYVICVIECFFEFEY